MKKLKQLLKVCILLISMCISSINFAQVDTGGTATTSDHQKQIIGYVTNWDAWKSTSAGVPSAGGLTHLNIDYSKYTILNFAFFGVAKDGSLHSGDHRNKQIYQQGVSQEPKDIFYTDVYSSWDMHILFGETEGIWYISPAVKQRAEAQGFQVQVGGNTWTNTNWGLSGVLPLPLHKENGAPGLIDLAHQKGVKVMASIGGWSMCKHFPEMAADPTKRARFIEGCKKLIATGFDGIDVDWEYPGPYSGMNFTGTQADFANYENLLKEIRNAIGPDKLLTSALSAAPEKLDGFNWTEVDKYMDYYNFMTFDYNGGWSDKAGYNSPLHTYPDAEKPNWNWQSTLQKLTDLGIPKNKICLGTPFYGRGVVTDGAAELNVKTVKRSETIDPDGPIITAADYTNWPKEVYDGTPNHFFIKQKALSSGSGWTRKWDGQAKVPYLIKDNFFLSYDDEESVGVKAQFINDNELAGTIVWTAYGDLELGGSVTSFGPKLKRWSDVKSPLVNKINEVFANGDGGGTNTPPTVNITAPANNSNFTAGSNIVIKASASDSDGNVTKVEFYSGNTKLGEDTTSPYQYSWQNIPAGNHTLTAKATDDDDATTTSSAISISVRGGTSTAPTVILTAPINGSNFTAGSTITIKASASDSDGSVTKVEFYSGNTKLGEDTTSPYQYSLQNVTAGMYMLTVRAVDNSGAVSIPATISITVTGSGGGACNGVPQYVAGTTYGQNEEVQNGDKKYKCKVPGWCSSTAAIYYEPGVGSAWSNAWTETGNCGSRIGEDSLVVKVFPNPISGNIINVALDSEVSKLESDSFRFQVFNASGIKIYDFQNNKLKKGKNIKSFDIGDLESGIYFYTILVSENKTTGKIIKK